MSEYEDNGYQTFNIDPEPMEDVVNEDIINIETETKDVSDQQVPVENTPFSDPCSEIPANYKQDNSTLSVPSQKRLDTDITDRLVEETERLKDEKTEPTQEVLYAFAQVLESFQQIMATCYGSAEFSDTFERSTSDWRQRVEGDSGKKISISNPLFSLDKSSDQLEGLNAVRYLSSVTGVGSVTRIPLWHSGIILTIDSFRERKLLDLHQTLVRQRMDIGTDTRGAIFTGDDVYLTSTIVNFILDHVIDSTVKDYTVKSLKSLILVLDIPALLAGALAAIYPRGYPVFHQCINTINNTCNYAIAAKLDENGEGYKPDSLLDFRKVLWVDRSKLTLEDRSHMTAYKPTYTTEQIVAYQKRVNYTEEDAIGFSIYKNSEVEVMCSFKIPTLEEYESSSIGWCSRVIDMVDKAMMVDTGLNEKDRTERRNVAIKEYAATIGLLKQSAWVNFLKIVDSDNIVRTMKDPKTISNSLEVFGQTDGFEDKFNTVIQEFKESKTISFTGLPNFQCPSCGTGQVLPNSKYPSIIPINMVSYFFILTVWRSHTRSEKKGT